MDSKKLAQACAHAASDKKAEDVVILDLTGISSFTDYFVICSGSSEPQLKAIASTIREQIREQFKLRPLKEDGSPFSHWIAIDYSDVIIHIFHTEKRRYYDLESLWKDAPRVC